MGEETPTILVVDDDASVRTALRRLLTIAGYRVETFADAAAFFEQAPRGKHGCILLDMKMPAMTGMEIQRHLSEAGIETPVIFISGFVDVPQTVDAMRAGALEVITKPFQEHTVLEAVRRALGEDEHRRLHRLEQEQVRERFDTMTARQRTVMSLVVSGLLNKQIAGVLGISEKTVKVHRSRVMEKMQAASLPDLVRMADRLGLKPDILVPTNGNDLP
jgi:FixJ family two-component response regulator